MTRPSNTWLRRSPRLTRALTIAGSAIALALVVFASVALSGVWRHPGTRDLTPAQLSEALYGEGQAALASGDATRAAELFAEAVQTDPSNSAAQAALKKTRSGASGGTSTESSSGSKLTSDSAAFLGTITLGRLLPTSFPDYFLSVPEGEGAALSVTGSPRKDTAIRTVIWTVRDEETTAAAAAYPGKVTKSLYAQSAATAVVNGASAYFGTDGTRFASAVYVRGRYVFEVIVTAMEGDPANVKAQTLACLGAFPAQPR